MNDQQKESRRKAVRKFKEAHTEQLALDLPKGTKERWKEEARQRDKSLTKLVIEAVEQYILYN